MEDGAACFKESLASCRLTWSRKSEKIPYEIYFCCVTDALVKLYFDLEAEAAACKLYTVHGQVRKCIKAEDDQKRLWIFLTKDGFSILFLEPHMNI